MFRFYSQFLILSLIPFLSCQAYGQDNFNIRYVGNALLSGSTCDVEIRGDFAYCTDKNGLTIYDLSDPENPIRIGQCHTPGLATKLTIQGDIAYIADISRGVAIVDISDPKAPRLVREFDLVMGAAWAHPIDVTVDDTILYICAGNDALYIADISDPTDPELLIRVGNEDPIFLDIIVRDSIAYLLDQEPGESVIILNVADPRDPRLIDFVDVPGRVSAFTLQNNLLTVVSNSVQAAHLWLYSVEDLLHPEELGHCELVEGTQIIEINGDYAFTAKRGIFQIIDITNPESPEAISHIQGLGNEEVGGIALRGDYAYLGANGEGLRVIGIGDPERPDVRNEPQQSYRTSAVVVEDGLAYVFDLSYGLYITDVSSPLKPQLLGDCELEGRIAPIVAKMIKYDNFIYATDHRYMWIIDVSDPDNPTPQGSFPNGFMSRLSVFIVDEYLYLIGSTPNLLVYDLSDPEEPELVFTYEDTEYNVWDAWIDGDMLYFVDSHMGSNNVFVLSLDDPSEPELIGDWGWDRYFSQILVNNRYAYMYFSRDWNGRPIDRIVTYSLENVLEPVAVDSFDIEKSVHNITLQEGRVCLHVEKYGFYCVSIEDPAHPEIVGYYDTPGCVNNIDSENGYLYVADEYELGIYRFEKSETKPDIEDLIGPSNFEIHAVHPNPFNSMTTISYSVPSFSHISLSVFDLSGRQVAALKNDYAEPGVYNTILQSGNLSSGIYFIRFESTGHIQSRKVILMR